jgi:poly-gamma-glutamate synthesis protein (capsule biosynthesis protein)
VPALKDAGIDAVLLANNHSFDYGETAFLDTLQNLKDGGIGILGAGLNDDEASAPFLFENEAGRAQCFGVASFPREWNGWDGLSAAAQSDKAGILHAGKGGGEKIKAQFSADDDILDIVLFHGGVEWSTSPSSFTREVYTDLAEAGADLIIGSHPHIVQGFEWVAGKPVFWSLGNYVFGGMENTNGGEEGLFVRLGFCGKSLVYLEPYALTLTHAKTSVASAENLETFYTRSAELRKAVY